MKNWRVSMDSGDISITIIIVSVIIGITTCQVSSNNKHTEITKNEDITTILKENLKKCEDTLKEIKLKNK